MMKLGFIEEYLSWIIDFTLSLGGYGVFAAMVLESSILPIPSEAILVTAGLLGIDPITSGFAGGLGSTVGAGLGYYIGKSGRSALYKYGKYILVSERSVSSAESWFKKWGGWAILISRLIPIIPFKVFSIAAGLLRMNYRTFLVLTLIGSIPRCLMLAWVGNMAVKASYDLLLVSALLILLILVSCWIIKRSGRRIFKES
ncbi:MAG: DedA family protein [Candidatus Bathyarchaeia archaeon]|nr:DedA family protein [Candidatus Bathyarchaeota archaeon]